MTPVVRGNSAFLPATKHSRRREGCFLVTVTVKDSPAVASVVVLERLMLNRSPLITAEFFTGRVDFPRRLRFPPAPGTLFDRIPKCRLAVFLFQALPDMLALFLSNYHLPCQRAAPLIRHSCFFLWLAFDLTMTPLPSCGLVHPSRTGWLFRFPSHWLLRSFMHQVAEHPLTRSLMAKDFNNSGS